MESTEISNRQLTIKFYIPLIKFLLQLYLACLVTFFCKRIVGYTDTDGQTDVAMSVCALKYTTKFKRVYTATLPR